MADGRPRESPLGIVEVFDGSRGADSGAAFGTTYVPWLVSLP